MRWRRRRRTDSPSTTSGSAAWRDLPPLPTRVRPPRQLSHVPVLRLPEVAGTQVLVPLAVSPFAAPPDEPTVEPVPAVGHGSSPPSEYAIATPPAYASHVPVPAPQDPFAGPFAASGGHLAVEPDEGATTAQPPRAPDALPAAADDGLAAAMAMLDAQVLRSRARAVAAGERAPEPEPSPAVRQRPTLASSRRLGLAVPQSAPAEPPPGATDPSEPAHPPEQPASAAPSDTADPAAPDLPDGHEQPAPAAAETPFATRWPAEPTVRADSTIAPEPSRAATPAPSSASSGNSGTASLAAPMPPSHPEQPVEPSPPAVREPEHEPGPAGQAAPTHIPPRRPPTTDGAATPSVPAAPETSLPLSSPPESSSPEWSPSESSPSESSSPESSPSGSPLPDAGDPPTPMTESGTAPAGPSRSRPQVAAGWLDPASPAPTGQVGAGLDAEPPAPAAITDPEADTGPERAAQGPSASPAVTVPSPNAPPTPLREAPSREAPAPALPEPPAAPATSAPETELAALSEPSVARTPRSVPPGPVSLPPDATAQATDATAPAADAATPATRYTVPATTIGTFRGMTGVDLGIVPVARGPQVAQAAARLGARAYTRGGVIHVPDDLGPLDAAGIQPLLGHELTHVAQQRARPADPLADHARLEESARRIEDRYASDSPEPDPGPESGPDGAHDGGLDDSLDAWRLLPGLTWTPATGFASDPSPDTVQRAPRDAPARPAAATAGATAGADGPPGQTGPADPSPLGPAPAPAYPPERPTPLDERTLADLAERVRVLIQPAGHGTPDPPAPLLAAAPAVLPDLLLDQVRAQLRRELLLDRERVGLLTGFHQE